MTAACQPVAMTSESDSSDGTRSSSGMPSVFTSEPSAWVTRVYSAWPLAVKPWWMQADCTPARQCTQVLSQWQNGTTTKSPGANERTSLPTSSTTPTHSWPIVDPGSMRFSPRYGHRSEPQTQPATTLTIASVAAASTGSGSSPSRMSRGAWIVVARMGLILATLLRGPFPPGGCAGGWWAGWRWSRGVSPAADSPRSVGESRVRTAYPPWEAPIDLLNVMNRRYAHDPPPLPRHPDDGDLRYLISEIAWRA